MRPSILARRRIHRLPVVPNVNSRRYYAASPTTKYNRVSSSSSSSSHQSCRVAGRLSHSPSCNSIPKSSIRRHYYCAFLDIAGNKESPLAANDLNIGKRFSSTDSFTIDHRDDQRGVSEGGETSGKEGEQLPRGVVRQSDFFGETITFVDDVDGCSVRLDGRSILQSHINDRSFDNGGGSSDGDRHHLARASLRTDEGVRPLTQQQRDDRISGAMSSFDGASLCILSRGSANLHSGNDADGPDARAFHASSLAWSEMLSHAWDWNNSDDVYSRDYAKEGGGGGRAQSITASPMLAVAAVAPALAQGGSHYVRRIDTLLSSTTRDPSSSGTYAESPPSLLTMARNAVSFRDAVLLPPAAFGGDNNSHIVIDPLAPSSEQTIPQHLLTPRERWHLHALHQLLQNNHRDAMGAYLRLLELYPGDVLGLSLALDVAYALGDSNAALRAATNVSTYWTERDGGTLRLQHSHPVQNMATSLIAVGLSSSSTSSRASTAERLAETAIARDADGTGGTSVWALSHCFASEGRSAEMVSKLSGYDGTQFYEACGYLHFSVRMRGYGGIALLDRKGAGADRSAVRMYDGGFGSVLKYSGNNLQGLERGGEEVSMRELRVPSSIKKDMAGALGSMLTGWFGGGDRSNGDGTKQEEPMREAEGSDPGLNDKQRKQRLLQRRTVEDVLCWLPPSPLLLMHATALLLRLTLSGAIAESDERWADLRAAWTLTIKGQNDDVELETNTTPVEYMPLAMIASSLVIHPNELHTKEVSLPLHNAMQGLHKFGKLMKLGQLKVVSASSQASSVAACVDDWRMVLSHLARARDSCQRWEMPTGISSSTYLLPNDVNLLSSISTPASHPIGWDFDLRQFLEYALIHAAMEVGDYESLCLARAICSEGTTLRSNCPELWWRYGRVLEMLGDEVAAENARAASISLGSGEGGATF